MKMLIRMNGNLKQERRLMEKVVDCANSFISNRTKVLVYPKDLMTIDIIPDEKIREEVEEILILDDDGNVLNRLRKGTVL